MGSFSAHIKKTLKEEKVEKKKIKKKSGGKDIQKKLLLLSIGVFLICITLSGCNQLSNAGDSERNKFIGTWKTTSDVPSINWTMTLFSDGSCTGAVIANTWAVKDGKLVFMKTTQDGTFAGAFHYIFSSNTTLTLTDVNTGTSKVYTKQ